MDIPPSEFGAYVKGLHKDADKGFSLQYAALQAHSPTLLPCKAAQRDRNITKNRYNNILPCKHPSYYNYIHHVCMYYNVSTNSIHILVCHNGTNMLIECTAVLWLYISMHYNIGRCRALWGEPDRSELAHKCANAVAIGVVDVH